MIKAEVVRVLAGCSWMWPCQSSMTVCMRKEGTLRAQPHPASRDVYVRSCALKQTVCSGEHAQTPCTRTSRG